MSFQLDNTGRVEVWADGACLNNGLPGAAAGIGVWFGDNHPYNVSRPIPNGYSATNNVAEILAVTFAARQAKKAGVTKLKIHTDSQFVIDCLTKWMVNWQSNGWIKADGSRVVNRRELIELDQELQFLDVKLNHVPGHSDNYGNIQADKLARDGANRTNNY